MLDAVRTGSHREGVFMVRCHSYLVHRVHDDGDHVIVLLDCVFEKTEETRSCGPNEINKEKGREDDHKVHLSPRVQLGVA